MIILFNMRYSVKCSTSSSVLTISLSVFLKSEVKTYIQVNERWIIRKTTIIWFYSCIPEVSFDMNTRCLNETPSSVIVKSEDDYNPEVSIKKTPSKEWELDVRALISTKKWLQNYGLHKNKLAMQQILPVIGFKMSEGKIWTSLVSSGLWNVIQCTSLK